MITDGLDYSTRRQNRLKMYLGLPLTRPPPKDFYEDSNYIYLGTQKAWDDYDTDPERKDWKRIQIPSEFNWVVWSQQGTLKSIFVKTILPYFHAKGYKIFIFEAKDGTLSRSLKKHIETDKIYPDAYTTTLPVVSFLPTYLTSPNLADSDKIPEEEMKIFDKHCTINAASISSSTEWATLFGGSTGGAEVLHILNKSCKGNLNEMYKYVQRGFFVDEQGHSVKIQSSTQGSIMRVMQMIRTDDFLDSKRGKDIDVEELWNNNQIGVVPFYQKRPEYMQIFVSKMYGKFITYSLKHPNTKMLIIHDDSQAYLNSQADAQNPANAAVKNSIRFGRSYGFNNVFTVQEMKDFNYSIFSLRTALFAGLITDFFEVRMNAEIKDAIDANRQAFRELPLPNSTLTRKIIRYLYVPRNETSSMGYFPSSPNCGGW